jgi:hypothetical protein
MIAGPLTTESGAPHAISGDIFATFLAELKAQTDGDLHNVAMKYPECIHSGTMELFLSIL